MSSRSAGKFTGFEHRVLATLVSFDRGRIFEEPANSNSHFHRRARLALKRGWLEEVRPVQDPRTYCAYRITPAGMAALDRWYLTAAGRSYQYMEPGRYTVGPHRLPPEPPQKRSRSRRR